MADWTRVGDFDVFPVRGDLTMSFTLADAPPVYDQLHPATKFYPTRAQVVVYSDPDEESPTLTLTGADFQTARYSEFDWPRDYDQLVTSVVDMLAREFD